MSGKFLSFVFPETTKKQIDQMPTAEMKLKFFEAVTNYGMYGIEPEGLGDIEKIIWIPMKDLINSCKSSKGGAPEGNTNARRQVSGKTTETTRNGKNNQNNPVSENQPKQPETTETTLNNHNHNHNGNGNVNENVNENSGAREDARTHTHAQTLTLSESQRRLSEEVRKVFEEANLPCGNQITFLTGPFVRAVRTLHSKYGEYNLHSDDILKACKNYASVVNDPNDYFKIKMPFDRLVEHEKFRDFLPSAFVKENWRKWGAAPPDRGKEDPGDSYLETCPKCGTKTMFWNNGRQTFECRSCGKTATYAEIYGG